MYSSILTEYDKAKHHSKQARKLSDFPETLSQWTPLTRTLSAYEKSLLPGPSVTVHIIKTVKVKVPYTNQLIVYSAADYERSSRISSSYVCINPDCEHPKFGRILHLYKHSFSDQECIICEINLFQPPVFDNEVKMWSVQLEATDKMILHFIATISPPLIVSIDETESLIWFLNYVHCHKQLSTS